MEKLQNFKQRLKGSSPRKEAYPCRASRTSGTVCLYGFEDQPTRTIIKMAIYKSRKNRKTPRYNINTRGSECLKIPLYRRDVGPRGCSLPLIDLSGNLTSRACGVVLIIATIKH